MFSPTWTLWCLNIQCIGLDDASDSKLKVLVQRVTEHARLRGQNGNIRKIFFLHDAAHFRYYYYCYYKFYFKSLRSAHIRSELKVCISLLKRSIWFELRAHIRVMVWIRTSINICKRIPKQKERFACIPHYHSVHPLLICPQLPTINPSLCVNWGNYSYLPKSYFLSICAS